MDQLSPAFKNPRKLGFGLLSALALFFVNRGCTAVNASPSWIVGTAWFAGAAAVVVVIIWLWDHTNHRHWLLRSCLSLGAVVAIAAASFGPIHEQYRREHAREPVAPPPVVAQPESPKASAPIAKVVKPQGPVKRKVEARTQASRPAPVTSAPAPAVSIPNPNNPAVYAPGGVVSVNQQGGQTAGTIINNGPPPPMSLDLQQRARLRTELAGYAAKVTVWEVMNAPDSHSIAEGLGEVLNGIPGWTAEWGNIELTTGSVGVIVRAGKDSSAGARIVELLHSFNIPGRLDPDPGIVTNDIIIHVGARLRR